MGSLGGSLKKAFKKSVKFNKDVFGGGYLRDGLRSLSGGGDSREGRVDELYGQARYDAGQGFAQSIATQRRALRTTARAYEGGRKALVAGRAQSQQDVRDIGAQTGANAQQSLTDRGLGNTTIVDNARQGISAGVSREASRINAHYDQLLAELGIGEAGATTRIRQGIGQSYEGLARTRAGLSSQHAQTIASLPTENPDEWLNSLLGIGGTFLGYGMFGGGGGGGGSSFGALPHPSSPNHINNVNLPY